jgi:hypothetical protein
MSRIDHHFRADLDRLCVAQDDIDIRPVTEDELDDLPAPARDDLHSWVSWGGGATGPSAPASSVGSDVSPVPDGCRARRGSSTPGLPRPPASST